MTQSRGDNSSGGHHPAASARGNNNDTLDNNNSNSKKNMTSPYLHRMIYYTQSLLVNVPQGGNTTDTDFDDTTKEGGADGEELMNILARSLLQCCDPYNLRSSLPIPTTFLEEENDDDCNMVMDDDDNSDDEDDDDEEEEEEEDNLPYYINPKKVRSGKPRPPTRVDVLRSILRCLAPVALDLSVRIACHVLQQSSSSLSSSSGSSASSKVVGLGKKERLQSYVLFGYWIGIAPQLAHIVSDLFGEFHKFGSYDDDDSCPLVLLPFVANKLQNIGSTAESTVTAATDSSTNTLTTEEEEDAEAAVVACESTYELLTLYCNKRYEHDYVRKWWDWDSVLFVLIHGHGHGHADSQDNDGDGDVVMTSTENESTNESDLTSSTNLIGGYSSDTNAPYCTSPTSHWKHATYQMKWYISRAIGSILALRPLPLTNFLKANNIYENEVPFVRHPWSIHCTDALWEYHLMKRLGRVVLLKLNGAERNDVRITFGHDENAAFRYEEDEKKTSDLTTTTTTVEETNDEKKMGKITNKDDKYTFQLPSIEEDVRKSIPLHPTLIHAGRGILLPRRGSVASYHQWCQSSLHHDDNPDESEAGMHSSSRSSSSSSCCFIPTKTTMTNMSLLGIAMSSDPHPPPILVCGPSGSGKSSVVREMARLCSSFEIDSQEDELLELHVDEETDSKTLLGSFVATDIPGEFVWMAGPLTLAARQGRWVLIEDVDRCPEEIQAALIRLLEERILPLGVGKDEKCHPRFRLFGTCVTNVNNSSATSSSSSKEKNVTRRKSVVSGGAGGKRILHPNLWRKVHVDPLPFTELRDVGRLLHPDLPVSVADAVLDVLRKLDKSGRHDELCESTNEEDSGDKSDKDILGHGSRHASVREYIKLLSRISSAIRFEPGSEYATESQRLICLAETADVFAMSCPNIDKRRNFLCQIGAPTWSLTADAALRYIENRIPSLSLGGEGYNNRCVEVGRARLLALKQEQEGDDRMGVALAPGKKRNFAETNHALRLMESVAVCASQNEPALLVGETGKWYCEFMIELCITNIVLTPCIHFHLYCNSTTARLRENYTRSKIGKLNRPVTTGAKSFPPDRFYRSTWWIQTVGNASCSTHCI